MDKQQGETRSFKTCTICNTVWQTRDDFLDDPDIFIVGYQVHFNTLTEWLFLFNHSCKGTLSVNAGEFTDLYTGPIFKDRLFGSEECPGHCLHERRLSPCPSKCECSFVREIIQVIKNWEKKYRSIKNTKNRHRALS